MSKPCVSTLRRRILPRLVDAEAVYSSGRSPEELNLLADIFAEDLEGENPESIDQAFRLHRRESTRFPTPAHILALLPRCRAVNDTLALPEAQIKCTPGYGIFLGCHSNSSLIDSFGTKFVQISATKATGLRAGHQSCRKKYQDAWFSGAVRCRDQ